MQAFRPLEKKVTTTILIKQKETESMARAELEDMQIKASCSSQRENQLYQLLRYLSSLKDEEQVVPVWTGFFYNDSNDSHQAAYLPMIVDSPTKHSTTYEMLIQTKQKAESLNLDETDLVSDHAIYSSVRSSNS